MPTLEEALAQQQLQQAGSVMGRPQQPGWRQNLPQTLGPTLGTGAQAGMDLLDMLMGQVSPLDAAGGGAANAVMGPLGKFEKVGYKPGQFRAAGLERTGGDLNPAQFVTLLQSMPGYERFRQLSQNMVRKGMGNEFPVYRGKAQTDPLMQALLNSQPLPPVTAVTSDPNIARHFAETGAQMTRKPTYVMKGRATPEDIYGLVPRRDTHGHEGELLLNAMNMKNPELAVKYFDAGGGMIQPTAPMKNWAAPGPAGPVAPVGKPVDYSADVIESLNQLFNYGK